MKINIYKGFSLQYGKSNKHQNIITNSINKAIRHFPNVSSIQIAFPNCILNLWGLNTLNPHELKDSDGFSYFLIGSPGCEPSLQVIQNIFKKPFGHLSDTQHLNGRFCVLQISNNGKSWKICNDWTGSIPVFYSQNVDIAVVSTLEPVVVDASDYSLSDLSKSSIVQLLVHGHFLGTDTLFKHMSVISPDTISIWTDGNFITSTNLNSLVTSKNYNNYGWDELAGIMHDLTVNSVKDALSSSNEWVVPLSGGLDSRLIACIAVDLGKSISTFTYNTSRNEILYAKQTASALNVPWNQISLGTSYLSDYTSQWHDWFGSSLHSHGMYQMSFLTKLQNLNLPYASGYIGDFVGGKQIAQMSSVHQATGKLLDTLLCKLQFWQYNELSSVLDFNLSPYFEEHEHMLQEQYIKLNMPDWQKLWMIFLKNHIARMSSYLGVMYDYGHSISTPFTNLELMRFTLQTPRVALEDRRLQKYMLLKFWPEIAKIPGSFSRFPVNLKTRFFAKSIVSRSIPPFLRFGSLAQFSKNENNAEINCVKTDGWKALTPITKDFDGRGFLKPRVITALADKAMKGDKLAYRKLRSLQSLVYRLTSL